MNLQTSNIAIDCPSVDIAAYIDGELSPDNELELEMHFAGCRDCTEKLNQQKEFLCALNSSLKDDLELPANFTKVVVTNAESRVNGLRRPAERFNALFICCGLFFFVLFVLGAEAGNAFGAAFNVFEQAAAVAGFAAHVVYDLSIGTVIVLRSLSSQIAVSSVASFLLLGIFALAFLGFSRLILRYQRT